MFVTRALCGGIYYTRPSILPTTRCSGAKVGGAHGKKKKRSLHPPFPHLEVVVLAVVARVNPGAPVLPHEVLLRLASSRLRPAAVHVHGTPRAIGGGGSGSSALGDDGRRDGRRPGATVASLRHGHRQAGHQTPHLSVVVFGAVGCGENVRVTFFSVGSQGGEGPRVSGWQKHKPFLVCRAVTSGKMRGPTAMVPCRKLQSLALPCVTAHTPATQQHQQHGRISSLSFQARGDDINHAEGYSPDQSPLLAVPSPTTTFTYSVPKLIPPGATIHICTTIGDRTTDLSLNPNPNLATCMCTPSDMFAYLEKPAWTAESSTGAAVPTQLLLRMKQPSFLFRKVDALSVRTVLCDVTRLLSRHAGVHPGLQQLVAGRGLDLLHALLRLVAHQVQLHPGAVRQLLNGNPVLLPAVDSTVILLRDSSSSKKEHYPHAWAESA